MAAPKREDRDPGSIRIEHEDGSVWLLLANLELRPIKPARKRGCKAEAAPAPEATLF